jgi:branched-chain amino acid transport system permease protein
MAGEAAALAEVPPPLAYALQQVFVAMPKAAIYGLLATAYALVFGLVGRINLAFGEIAATGAAAAVAGVAAMLGLGIAGPLAGLGAGLVAAAFAGGLYGFAGGHMTIIPIRDGAQPSLIASVGLSLALMEWLRVLQGPATVWLPPVLSQTVPLARAEDFLVVLTPVSLLTTGLGLLTGSGLVAAMRYSPFGRAWRATADDAFAAALFGIDGRRLLLATLALSGAMAGLAGLLIVVQYGGLGFADGFQFGLKALIAAVLGGIGSVPGALLGGIAVGAFEAAWSAALPIEARDIALYAALAAILALRPGGFAGSRDRLPRRV